MERVGRMQTRRNKKTEVLSVSQGVNSWKPRDLREPQDSQQMFKIIPHKDFWGTLFALLQKNSCLSQLTISHFQTSTIYDKSVILTIWSSTAFLKNIALKVEVCYGLLEKYILLMYLLTLSKHSSIYIFSCKYYMFFHLKSFLKFNLVTLLSDCYWKPSRKERWTPKILWHQYSLCICQSTSITSQNPNLQILATCIPISPTPQKFLGRCHLVLMICTSLN